MNLCDSLSVLLQIVMAETKIEEKVEEAAKIDLFEDDDEFEEFEIGLGIPLFLFPQFFNYRNS